MDLQQYGAYLRSQRIGQGKGKEEVAATMHIPVALLEAWEDGARLPDEQQLQLLSAVLQVPFEQIYPDDAPRQRRPLPQGRVALIIAGVVFALAMTIWSMRTSVDMTSSFEERANTLMEEALNASMKRTETQSALSFVESSALFQQLGLEKEALTLADYESRYGYGAKGLVERVEVTFQAGEYQFLVYMEKQDGEWQVTEGTALLPLE